MKDPRIKTKVVHSQSKEAWNIIGDELGGKFKIARVPYILCGDDIIDTRNKAQALEHALFISKCFNNSDDICDFLI